ncbi:MAG: iron-sulfur cluster assembly accessory protein [Candidatus Aenigmarchaeota archaeon]|nr:iron-sulfur cluster assembly accessory protein [Candidatus Aenigmarchaeota archaeon]
MEAETQMITKDMTIGDIVEKYPETTDIMMSYGLHCFGCHVNVYETLEQGIASHGMEETALESMLEDMNKAVAKRATMPAEEIKKLEGGKVVVTDFAAKKVLEIMKSNGKEGWCLRIGVKRGGCSGYSYLMDFEQAPASDDTVLEKNGLKYFIDPKSMEMLNGAVIDYVESLQGAGFKIENPNAQSSCGCGKSFG